MEIHALTRVGALLEAHPELEETLIACAPAFEKLRNPVLRATVAKVATLEQVARVGGLPLPDLLQALRRRLGEPEGISEAQVSSPPGAEWPPWYRASAVIERLDATAMLVEGRHPWGVVKQLLATHPPGAIVAVDSDFEPAPMIDQARQHHWLVACLRQGDRHCTVLRRP